MSEKKILDNSPVSGIAVPIAIVLVGALIIWGVTQMLSSGRNHKDLVNELHSKTFGNRWVAAYELSKYIASSSIPDSDIPWVVENLGEVYIKASNDPKTRNFVVMALGGIDSPLGIPYLVQAVDDSDREVGFHAIVALGKITMSSEQKSEVSWDKIAQKISSEDQGVSQVAIIALTQHEIKEFNDEIRKRLQSDNLILKYTAAQALVALSQNRPEQIIEEIIVLKENEKLNSAQVESLKLNLISALQKNGDSQSKKWLEKLSLDKNIKISTKAIQFLNLLKK